MATASNTEARTLAGNSQPGEQDDPATGGKRKFKWLITIDSREQVRFDSYDQDARGNYFKNTEVIGRREAAGASRMMSTTSRVLPARGGTTLAPDGAHIMLLQVKQKLVAGDAVTLYLSLSRMGAVEVRAPVVPYSELEKVLGLANKQAK